VWRSTLAGVRRQTLSSLALAGAAALTLAACGGSGHTTSSASAPATTNAPATTAPPASTAAGARTTQAIAETATMTLARRRGIADYEERGTVTGTFPGTMALRAKLVSNGLAITFTAQLPGGTVAGTGLATITLGGGGKLVPLKGTATFTRGSGRFAHAAGNRLHIAGAAALDGSRAVVRLTGTVTY
jgi:hypothetical protein